MPDDILDHEHVCELLNALSHTHAESEKAELWRKLTAHDKAILAWRSAAMPFLERMRKDMRCRGAMPWDVEFAAIDALLPPEPTP